MLKTLNNKLHKTTIFSILQIVKFTLQHSLIDLLLFIIS